MKIKDVLIKKRTTPYYTIHTILILLIAIMLIAPTIILHVAAITDTEQPDLPWKNYPYQPPGTDIIFPTDEGAHDTCKYPIEWWYANFHLTGQTTGREYGAFVAFYKIKTTVAETREIMIFSISDIAIEKTYTNVKLGTLTTCPDYLDLSFEYITNDYEIDNQTISEIFDTNLLVNEQEYTLENDCIETTIDSTSKNITKGTLQYENPQTMNVINENDSDYEIITNESTQLQYDRWYTKSNDQGLLPFQYSLTVAGNSQQDHQPMKLIVDMDCRKQPLIVGGDGIIFFSNQDFSYYYSLTRLQVTGKITLNDLTEDVFGNAWIDHQWGNFVNQNPPPCGLTMTYEWFSIQLQDNQEIVVGDTWDRVTGEKINQSYTDGLNICNNDGASEKLKDYSITPLGFWNDTGDERFYSCQWHLTETSKSIDLIVTPVFSLQMMRFTENYPLLQEILEELFPGACFWEGVCTVTGTINGVAVNGKSYVELTHYYDNLEE